MDIYNGYILTTDGYLQRVGYLQRMDIYNELDIYNGWISNRGGYVLRTTDKYLLGMGILLQMDLQWTDSQRIHFTGRWQLVYRCANELDLQRMNIYNGWI
jgi:hypothetical protein